MTLNEEELKRLIDQRLIEHGLEIPKENITPEVVDRLPDEGEIAPGWLRHLGTVGNYLGYAVIKAGKVCRLLLLGLGYWSLAHFVGDVAIPKSREAVQELAAMVRGDQPVVIQRPSSRDGPHYVAYAEGWEDEESDAKLSATTSSTTFTELNLLPTNTVSDRAIINMTSPPSTGGTGEVS